MLTVAHESVRKAKGVARYTVSKKLTHDNYKRIYESLYEEDDDGQPNPKVMRLEQRRIGAINHQLFTISNNKIALSAVDDKRMWTTPNSSLPYGHFSLHDAAATTAAAANN